MVNKNLPPDPEPEEGSQDLFLAPSSESQARAAALLAVEPSEDASDILGELDLPDEDETDSEEYGPDEAVEWVVTATFPGSLRLDPQRVNSLLSPEWKKEHGAGFTYGRDADTSQWTHLLARNGPAAVTALKIGWDFCRFDSKSPATEKEFTTRLQEVRQRLSTLEPSRVEASMPSAAAAEHSRLLHEVRANLDHTAVLILKAPPGKPYNGRKLWDVMLCLGLEWGDMDCFHWMNSSEVGDDSLFSVETSTPPGFFFPEELAAGTMKPADLVFLFSVPRSAAPLAVFDAMVRAMEYCRKRLGGQICDDAGNPANIREARAVIADIESQLRAAGFPPGADRTLRLF